MLSDYLVAKLGLSSSIRPNIPPSDDALKVNKACLISDKRLISTCHLRPFPGFVLRTGSGGRDSASMEVSI